MKNSDNFALSRRRFAFGFSLLPVAIAKNDSDGLLVSQGQTFEQLANQVDDAIRGHDITEFTLRAFGEIADTIAATPALTTVGLRVKARAACWALLGDLEIPTEATIDRKMALSIVRDIIRIFDPRLESPGAIRRLIPSE